MTLGAERIATERQRQMDVEDWTPEHDAEHDPGDLIRAAFTYLTWDYSETHERDVLLSRPVRWRRAASALWPWQPEWFKPSDDPIRNLVRAGALIAAEIDRLERKASR